ncbi:MAG: carbon storage regulator [Pirellulaceae bacterium]|nr:carbon storage regulator [Pirellulaceae bacterium]
MLVLSRKTNQKLQIGNDIVITVVKVKGNTIRLGIEAPRNVRVIRSELEFKLDTSLTAGLVGDQDQAAEGVPDRPWPGGRRMVGRSMHRRDTAVYKDADAYSEVAAYLDITAPAEASRQARLIGHVD